MQTALNDYASWQALPAKDALEKYTGVQSQLSSITSVCSGASNATPLQSESLLRLSFEMSSLSEMVSFGCLGRIVVGGGLKEERENHLVTDSEAGNHETSGGLPPNKRRKK